MDNDDYKTLYEELQKDTNDKLKRQEHTIAKLEKKIDKIQQQNHSQMQTLDIRMQQMMGMFQMFMMNQTMNAQQPTANGSDPQQAPPAVSQSNPASPQRASAHSQNDANILVPGTEGTANITTTPSRLPQSKSVMHIDQPPMASDIHKSRSFGNIEDDKSHRHRHRSAKRSDALSDTDYDTDTDVEDGLYANSRDASKSRRKHRSKKEREKDRERRRKEKRKKKKHKKDKRSDIDKDSSTHSVPQFDENNMDVSVPPPPGAFDETRQRAATTGPRMSASGRVIPPPPPKDGDAPLPILRNGDSSPKPPPPSREGRGRKHKSSKKKHRDASKSRKRDKHHQSHSEDVSDFTENKKRVRIEHSKKRKRDKKPDSVDVVNFVEIDTKYGKTSPTEDSRTLLDHLHTLTLDVSSDEESLIYVHDDGLSKEEDPDIEVSYDWESRKGKSNKKSKKKKLEVHEEESGDSGDDVSMLSASKPLLAAGKAIDDEDLGDSDYYFILFNSPEEEESESLHSSEDEEEEHEHSEPEQESPNEAEDQELTKAERKRRRKEEKKRRKKEKKRKRKEEKKRKKREKEQQQKAMENAFGGSGNEIKSSKKKKQKTSLSSSIGERFGENLNKLISKKDNPDSNSTTTMGVMSKERSASSGKNVTGQEDESHPRQAGQVNDGEVPMQRRQTLTGKIKKNLQKFKIGGGKDRDKNDDIDQMDQDKLMKVDDESVSSVSFKIRPNPLNKTATMTFKDMFKSKKNKTPSTVEKRHKRDDSYVSMDYSKVIGNEEELVANRERAHTTSSTVAVSAEKKKKRGLNLRGFKARNTNSKGHGVDDDQVDYGDRRLSNKQKQKSKRRRGSDSNISDMQLDWDKKHKKKKKFRVDAELSILEPDIDDEEMTPPPSPFDKGLIFDHAHAAMADEHLPPSDEDDDDDLDSEVNDNNDSDGGPPPKKTGSIDDYKSRGSKSNSKDMNISEDIDEHGADFGVEVDADYDPDIDVGDYDWKSYTIKKSANHHKTKTDEDLPVTESTSKLMSPNAAAIRPQSARVVNAKSPFGKKGESGFFAQNVEPKLNKKPIENQSAKKTTNTNTNTNTNAKKEENTESKKNETKSEKNKSSKKAEKKKKDKDKDKEKEKESSSKKEDKMKKPEKLKPIKVAPKNKESSGKKSRPSTPKTSRPSTPKKSRPVTPMTPGGKRKGKNLTAKSNTAPKRKSEMLLSTNKKKPKKNNKRKSELPKKSSASKASKSSAKSKEQSPTSPIQITPSTPTPPAFSKDDEESKDPEVLLRARGQSIYKAIMASDSTGSLDAVDLEYTFATKKMKANVPKLDYAKYEAMPDRPSYRLTLDHVHGYMGYDALCRNNLYSLKSDVSNMIVYNVGCVAVIHDLESNEQTIYRDHKCPITSITVHPSGEYIATSSLKSPLSSTTPSVHVWNPKEVESITPATEIMFDEMIGEVRHLTFSPSSDLLFLTCGDNQKNTQLMAFQLEAPKKPVINMEFRTIANKNVQIYGMAFNPRPESTKYADQFVVFGSNILYWCQSQYTDGKPVAAQNINDKNIKFRYCKINKLQPKGSTDGKKEKAYHCGLFLQCTNNNNIGYYVLGGQSGTIYMGYRNTIICSLAGHNGRVQSLQQFAENMFLSIGHDGTWKIWNVNYDQAKFKEISVKLRKKEDANKPNDDSKDEYEFEEKRSIPDASTDIMKSGALKIICEDSYSPSNDTVSKAPHACYYDTDKKILYVGTSCNSIVSVSNINTKNGAHDVEVISSGHTQGIVGVAISPKLDSLIATLSEEGLLRLWNVSQAVRLRKVSSIRTGKTKSDATKRVDTCVGRLSLLSQKQQTKLRSTVLAWSPDGKYIATGYSTAKVSLCTTHPLNKVLDIDLSQYKAQKGKPIKATTPVTALCFSYDKSVLAVAHSNQLSLFNIEKMSKKPSKWDATLTLKDNIKYLYFSEEDNILGVITEKYESKFYDIKMKKRSLREATSPPKCDVVWWPRVPITSFVLKGLYQKETMKWRQSELIDADICESLQVVASADEFGVIRLHELPAINEEAHHSYKHHCGPVSKVLFIPDQQILISVGLQDRSILKWRIDSAEMPNSPYSVMSYTHSTML